MNCTFFNLKYEHGYTIFWKETIWETWKYGTERNLGEMGSEVVDFVQVAPMASFVIVGDDLR
jgi:hypothetical protein